MSWRAGSALLAVLVGVAGFVAPFYALYADRALLPVVFTFATLGFVLVLLGAFLVLWAWSAGRSAGVEGESDDEKGSRLLMRASFGWVWVALGLALRGLQLAIIFIAWLVPRGT